MSANAMSRADKTRIYILILALLAVLIMWKAFFRRAGDGESRTTQVVFLPPKAGAGAVGGEEKPKENPLVGEDEGASPGDPFTTPPLVPTEGFVDPDPPEPVYRGDTQKVLAGVVDARPVEEGAEIQGMELEPEAFAYLLHKLRTTPADAPERANAPWTTQSDMLPTPEELRENRHRLRGKWVKVIGTLQGDVYDPIPVTEPGPSGVYQVYRSFLLDNGSKLINVYTVHNVPHFKAKEDVETEGLFFKMHAYENQLGQIVAVPVVVAERLRAYRKEPGSPSVLFEWVVPGILAVAGIALVFIVIAGGVPGRGGRRATPRPAR